MSDISVLFGIGNPGARYRHTRHNVGVDTIAALADRHNLSWKPVDSIARSAHWRYGGRRILLIQSQTYMNMSGDVLAASGGIDPEMLIVVCDDINLPMGRLRIRAGGGSGGHRGLESIIEAISTEEFARLRVGVGAPEPDGDLSEYVLSAFDEDERSKADLMVRIAADALEVIVRTGLEEAMQRYNKKDPGSQ